MFAPVQQPIGRPVVINLPASFVSPVARVGPKLPCPCDCKTVWEELASSVPSYELVGDQLIQFLKSLKTWDGASPLTLNFGTVEPRGVHVLVTGSVYLVGDVLSVSVHFAILVGSEASFSETAAF
ncbi:unnamed protein product [Taenia asiatica]|uniref:Uncharacterized protein n=1 Tax=Taenia asiatica TaxID=60517 RepID=A0A3P6NP80_TAEAS|nr:unnamed protein product [Taenia asiatica]